MFQLRRASRQGSAGQACSEPRCCAHWPSCLRRTSAQVPVPTLPVPIARPRHRRGSSRRPSAAPSAATPVQPGPPPATQDWRGCPSRSPVRQLTASRSAPGSNWRVLSARAADGALVADRRAFLRGRSRPSRCEPGNYRHPCRLRFRQRHEARQRWGQQGLRDQVADQRRRALARRLDRGCPDSRPRLLSFSGLRAAAGQLGRPP